MIFYSFEHVGELVTIHQPQPNFGPKPARASLLEWWPCWPTSHRLPPRLVRPALNPTAAFPASEPSGRAVCPGPRADRGAVEALEGHQAKPGDSVWSPGGCLGWAALLFLRLAIAVQVSASPGAVFYVQRRSGAVTESFGCIQIPKPCVRDAIASCTPLRSNPRTFRRGSRKTSNSKADRSRASRPSAVPAADLQP